MQPGQLKYFRAMLFYMLFAGIHKVANIGAAFVFIGSDWLNPQEQKQGRPWIVAFLVFTQCIIVYFGTIVVWTNKISCYKWF